MKQIFKKMIGALGLLAILGVTASGCVEHRYYHEHHYHTGGWYHRHNQTPPPGVNIDIHN